MNARQLRAMRLTPSSATRERAGVNAVARERPSPAVAGEVAAATVALLLLVRFHSRAVPWGLSRLVLGDRALGHVPGLRFARVLGSGRGGGFGLAPGFDHQGLMCFFGDEYS